MAGCDFLKIYKELGRMKDKVKVSFSSPDAEAAQNKSLVQHWGCYCDES